MTAAAFRLLFAVVWAALLAPVSALAQEAENGAGPWVNAGKADVRLISALTTTGGGTDLRLGLDFRLQEGWKIYWRSPGDAGYPPSIDWSGSSNIGPVSMAWPAPHRFSLLGIETAGYGQRVVFPLSAPLLDPAAPVVLKAGVDFLICSDICVPGQARLEWALPPGPGELSPTNRLIERYAAQVPGPSHGIRLESATVAKAPGGATGQILSVVVTADPPLTAPDLFAEGDLSPGAGRGIVSGAPTIHLDGGGRRAVLRAPVTLATPDALPPLTLTVVDGPRGLEITTTPTRAAAPIQISAPATPASDLWPMLTIALLGGLVLNLMPCVLPVLSLKVMGFLGHGGGERRGIRLAFLASAAGVVSAFLVLAGVLVALKVAGQAVGWGIQFQEPWFLGAMIALLLLFAANLWGMFHIPLPAALGSAAAKPAGHFAGGVFATLLATPCSAPFVGTAVGFALARGPLEIVAVFLALGVGMAAPYLLVAAAPVLARALPRPGRWMITLRKVFALALTLTALWLGWVLSGVLAPAAQAGGETTPPGSAVSWQPFERSAIDGLVATGKVVVVDVTADWCITCKVNKAAVLDRGAVAEALAAPGVVALRADWTRPDAAISAFLNDHGRYGIPFNIVYGPGAPQGLPLPELLTEDAVLAALRAARG